jgi:hypothetical protein
VLGRGRLYTVKSFRGMVHRGFMRSPAELNTVFRSVAAGGNTYSAINLL